MSIQDDQVNLQDFSVSISRQLEEAEARIPRLNEIIERIVSLGCVTDVALLGDIVLCRPYSAGNGSEDSEQLLKATILLPGGIGATAWDSEEHFQLQRTPGALEATARSKFVPFAQLANVEKALVMMFTPPLLARLCKMVLPPPPNGDGSTLSPWES